MFICFWKAVWDCQVPAFTASTTPVPGDPGDMDMAGMEYLRHRINEKPVFFCCKHRCSPPIGGCKMPAFQHRLHHFAGFFVFCAGDEADEIVNTPSMVHQHPGTLDRDNSRVLHKEAVLREG